MEVNSVQELHKKFEDLNDEIAQALRRQEDAISSTTAATSSTSASTTPGSRKNVLQLTTRAIDWREDVNALAKHIDIQLQNSRALRTREAEVLLRDGDTKQVEDDDSAKLRCLRSDLRLLQSFRLAHVHATAGNDISAFSTVLHALDADWKAQKELIDLSIRGEKTGRKEIQVATIIQLFEARRELMAKISEDILKATRQIDDDDGGLSDVLRTNSNGSGGSDIGASDKDILASLDAQMYLRLVRGMLALEKDLKARFSDGVYTQQQQQTAASHDHLAVTSEDNQTPNKSPPSTVSTASAFTNAIKTTGLSPSLDEVNFALQKLRRDHAELQQAHAKLEMAYAQREDDLANLQRKYDDDKRAHVNEKKWYAPKIQKLEETVLTTAKAFEALKLNVELLTNMYKSLRQTLVAHELDEQELKRERTRVTSLLADEIKKVALLTKENARKEKLVLIAMSARHEMCAALKHSDARRQGCENDKLAAEQHTTECVEELTVAKVQLEYAYSRLQTAEEALTTATATVERLQCEIGVCIEAASVKEAEIKSQYETQLQTLQQRFDKIKRELMDAMAQNLSLDGRLRKAKERLTKMVETADAVKATDTLSTT